MDAINTAPTWAVRARMTQCLSIQPKTWLQTKAGTLDLPAGHARTPRRDAGTLSGSILHDANHRLVNRNSNRLSCVVIDEARRTFKQDIVRVLEDIELAERLQRIVAASPHPGGKDIAPSPWATDPSHRRCEVNVLAREKRTQPGRRHRHIPVVCGHTAS